MGDKSGLTQQQLLQRMLQAQGQVQQHSATTGPPPSAPTLGSPHPSAGGTGGSAPGNGRPAPPLRSPQPGQPSPVAGAGSNVGAPPGTPSTQQQQQLLLQQYQALLAQRAALQASQQYALKSGSAAAAIQQQQLQQQLQQQQLALQQQFNALHPAATMTPLGVAAGPMSAAMPSPAVSAKAPGSPYYTAAAGPHGKGMALLSAQQQLHTAQQQQQQQQQQAMAQQRAAAVSIDVTKVLAQLSAQLAKIDAGLAMPEVDPETREKLLTIKRKLEADYKVWRATADQKAATMAAAAAAGGGGAGSGIPGTVVSSPRQGGGRSSAPAGPPLLAQGSLLPGTAAAAPVGSLTPSASGEVVPKHSAKPPPPGMRGGLRRSLHGRNETCASSMHLAPRAGTLPAARSLPPPGPPLFPATPQSSTLLFTQVPLHGMGTFADILTPRPEPRPWKRGSGLAGGGILNAAPAILTPGPPPDLSEYASTSQERRMDVLLKRAHVRVGPELESALLEHADHFLEAVVAGASAIARARGSAVVEPADMVLELDRWGLKVPGHSHAPKIKKANTTLTLHANRLAAVTKAKRAAAAATAARSY